MLCTYIVHTTAGTNAIAGPWQIMAINAAQAALTAIELAGPGAKVLRITKEGDC